MSKWDKLITRICNLSKDLRFDELRKVLESYGYEMNAPRSGSSHYTFRKQGCMPITIPKHEPIKKVYVRNGKADCMRGEGMMKTLNDYMAMSIVWKLWKIKMKERICSFLIGFAWLHYLPVRQWRVR